MIKINPLSLSTLLRDAFLAGAGVIEGTIPQPTLEAWLNYEPSCMELYNKLDAALTEYRLLAKAAPADVELLDYVEPDKRRLNWMIAKRAEVIKHPDAAMFFVRWHEGDTISETPNFHEAREAIDHAMKVSYEQTN